MTASPQDAADGAGADAEPLPELVADGQFVNRKQRPVSADDLLRSTHPAALNPSRLVAPALLWCQRGDSQCKLTESVEAAPLSNAARRAARRASVKEDEAELAKMFARGAKGTKDGPGRFSSRSGTLPAHFYPLPAPSSHNGPDCCSSSVDGITAVSGARRRKGMDDDLWAPVRARLAAIRAADALQERDLADQQAGIREKRLERARQLLKERRQHLQRSHCGQKGFSSGQEPVIRV